VSALPRLPQARAAPAKVNLGLAITGRRADGYHELRSVFLRIGMRDRLIGAVAGSTGSDRLTVTGDQDCPVDGNIVLRALQLLRQSMPPGRQLPALSLELEKRIPVAAGLGGGSSDGAAALGLAADLWGLQPPKEERDRLAAQLGADVPFFAERLAAALVTGVGDRMRGLAAILGEPGLLLVTPRERLSTADVFAAFDRLDAPTCADQVVDELAEAFERGLDPPTLAGWAARLRDANDLWPAAVSLQPGMEGLRAELERVLDRPFLLSGSGSTLFALYASVRAATDAGDRLASTVRQGLTGAEVFVAGVDVDQDAGRIQ
jgi:4-diphosphocytidyl-2-C-methyl-D-erythritol kinase